MERDVSKKGKKGREGVLVRKSNGKYQKQILVLKV